MCSSDLPNGQLIAFELDPTRKQRLLLGLDDIGLTLEDANIIREFETRHRQQQPWLFTKV